MQKPTPPSERVNRHRSVPVPENAGNDDRDNRSNKKRKSSGKRKLIMAALPFAVVLLLIVLISPKEPISRAYYTTATESGKVSEYASTTHYYDGLRISEVMTSNQTAVPDENGNYPDWVELWNSSDHAISLKNVGLSNKATKIRFLFPSVVLEPDQRIVVFCSNTNRVESGKPFHAKFKLSSSDGTVFLFDPNAYLIDHVAAPIMASDESYALVDGKYIVTDQYSPTEPNTVEGYQSYRASALMEGSELVISEICPDPLTGLRDEDDELSDWIELYNGSDKVVYLKNYALSDNEGKPLKWHFPEDAAISPHGYYVVFASGKDRTSTRVPHTNFRISAEHETVVLADNRGRIIDRVTVDNVPKDYSLARNEDGTFSLHQVTTPGYPNTSAGENQMDATMRSLNTTGVYITEVCASNSKIALNGGTETPDWIELYNSSSVSVDLSGFGLSDNLERARKWQFPAGTSIGPGEYLVVYCDGNSSQATTTIPRTSYKIKRIGGEIATLATPTGKILDRVILPKIPTNVSYGRSIGKAGFFYYDTPTPGSQNGDGFSGYVNTPEFLVEPGMYSSSVVTGFTVPEGSTVFYTTDGSDPTVSSIPYTPGQQIEMNFTGVLRAKAFSAVGLHSSETITGTYFISTYHTLPVVSVVTDPDNLWNPNNGMLTIGDNIIKEAPGKLPFDNAIYREFGKIPRECHVEFYKTDGTCLLSQGGCFELSGNFSLDMPQKSFKFRAKSEYGGKTFPAALFDDREFTEYKSFVLRNSGNDCAWTRLLDGFQSRLMDAYGTTVLHQAWNPCAVYLNGVYWGHFNMRERVDKYFVAQHEGLTFDDADNITILMGNGTAKEGSNKEYKAMLKKIKAGDPANNPEDLQYILDNVDVDNYFEYIALEMFFGNSDIANMKLYKTGQEGSKWKWIAYDLDYGMYDSTWNSPQQYTLTKGMGRDHVNNTILLKLLSVPEYKDKFLRKLGDIFQTFTTDMMLETLEPLVKQIEPEMNIHFTRWAEEHDQMVISEWPTTVDGAYRYWESRIARLRNTCRKRPNILWGDIQDAFHLTQQEMLDYFGPKPDIPE